MAYGPNRTGAVRRGEVHALFDEGASIWGNMALELGMSFLSLDETILTPSESVGLCRGVIEKRHYPKLSADVSTLDFSGWPIYLHRDTPDMHVSDFCRALEASKDRIPWADERRSRSRRWCATLPNAISKCRSIPPPKSFGGNAGIYRCG